MENVFVGKVVTPLKDYKLAPIGKAYTIERVIVKNRNSVYITLKGSTACFSPKSFTESHCTPVLAIQPHQQPKGTPPGTKPNMEMSNV